MEYKPSSVSVMVFKTNGFIPLFCAISYQIGDAFTLADMQHIQITYVA